MYPISNNNLIVCLIELYILAYNTASLALFSRCVQCYVTSWIKIINNNNSSGNNVFFILHLYWCYFLHWPLRSTISLQLLLFLVIYIPLSKFYCLVFTHVQCFWNYFKIFVFQYDSVGKCMSFNALLIQTIFFEQNLVSKKMPGLMLFWHVWEKLEPH